MAVASLVIITLVKAVRAGREHLLAGEMRPVLLWGQVRRWQCQPRDCFQAAHVIKGTLDI